MAPIPAVQIMVNAEQMKIYFDAGSSTYIAYNLYHSAAANMAGEALVARIADEPDGTYSRSQAVYSFRRSTLGYVESDIFYMRLKGILPSGAEDGGSVGATAYIPNVFDKIPSYNPVQLYGNDGNVWLRTKSDSDGKLDVV